MLQPQRAASEPPSRASLLAAQQAAMILGDVVRVPQGAGTIQFIGTTSFAEGEWIGVVLEEPNGKNDGSVRSVRYFDCLHNHGVFVRRNNCTKDDGRGNLAVSPTAAEQPIRRSKRKGKTEGADAESSAELEKWPSRPTNGTTSTTSTSSIVDHDAASTRQQHSGRRKPKDCVRVTQHDAQEQSSDQLWEALGTLTRADCKSEESAVSAQLHLAEATEEQDLDKLRIVLPFAASLGVARRDLEAARQVLHFKANHVYLHEVQNIESVIKNLSRAAQGKSRQPQAQLLTSQNKPPAEVAEAGLRVEERVLEEIRVTCTAAVQTTCDDLRRSFDGFVHELRQDLSVIRSELQGALNGRTSLARASTESTVHQTSLTSVSTESSVYQESLPRVSAVASTNESLPTASSKASTKSLYEESRAAESTAPESLPRDSATSSYSPTKGKSIRRSLRTKSVIIDDQAELMSPTASLSGPASPTLEKRERKSERKREKDREREEDSAQKTLPPSASWAESLSNVSLLSSSFFQSIMGDDGPEEEYFTTERLQAIIRGDDDSEEARRLQKAVLVIQRCIRRLKGSWDAHAEKGQTLLSIAHAARTRNARLATIFDRHRGKKDGLVEEAFLEAMTEAHPRLSEEQITALFEGFCGGTHKPQMDFRPFNSICDAVSSGDRAACEYAHLPLEDFEDLAHLSKAAKSSVGFRKSRITNGSRAHR